MIKKNSPYTKVKVLIGYILIAAFSAASSYFVFKEIQSFFMEEDQNEEDQEISNLINDAISNLYNAESYIGPMIVDSSDYYLYKRSSNLAIKKIDLLRNLLKDSFQIKQADSILILLEEKEDCLLNLMKLTNQNELEKIYRENILDILDEDTVIKDYKKIEKKTILKQDTILQNKPARRKGFFKRIVQIFSENEPDTTIKIYSSEHTYIDSLVNYYNPADSILKIFNEIEEELSKEKNETDSILTLQVSELRKNSNLISIKIKNILSQLDNNYNKSKALSILYKKKQIEKIGDLLSLLTAISIFIIILFLFLIWKDLSKSKKYRRELENSNDKLQKMMTNQEKLMLSITHDMKAPLGSIIGYIELLSGTKLSEKQRYYLDNMKGSSEHSLHLISNIIENNRLDDNEIEINSIPFFVEKLFNTIYQTFEPIALKKGLLFNYKLNDKLNSEFLGDPLKIREIVENLISNAIKFTEKGSISLDVEVKELNKNFATISISVKDTGRGISQENIDKIFLEYTRIHEKKSEIIEGFGLGLSIVKKIVDIMKGKITVNSTIGSGSDFTVEMTLPYSIKTSDTNQDTNQAIKILVLDDDEAMLTLITEMLKKIGVQTETSKYPDDALNKLITKDFDLFFTDIQMPEANGFDLVKQIRNIRVKNLETLPIIALSARADITQKQIEKEGFSDFLGKPFKLDQLSLLIKKHTQKNTLQIKDVQTNNKNGKFENLLTYACGDIDSEKSILTSFIKENEININQLSEYILSSNLNGIKQLAHKMLPIYKMLEEKDICTWLIKIEQIKGTDEFSNEEFLKHKEKIMGIIADAHKILNTDCYN